MSELLELSETPELLINNYKNEDICYRNELCLAQ